MDIKLYDENLEIYGKPIDTFSSLTYTDRWSADGEFKLVLPVEKYNDVKDAAYLYVDGRMFEIATINTCDQSANNQLTLSGHNLNVLLSRVVISTPERIQGKLETEIRTLVSSLCISGWQAIPKFALGTLRGYARAMDANAKRGSLSDFLYTELNKRGFSFSLTYDDVNDEIVFDIVQSLDRTQDQTDNTFATFSASLGNVQNMEYERNESEYYNCAVVCDEAETDPQTVIVDLSNGEPKRTIYVSGSSAGADDSAAPNLLVAVGNAGYIATSTDGINWTQRTSGTTNSLWSVDYQNGLFAAGGTGGIVVVSPDGINWTVRATGSSELIRGVGYEDGAYFALDQNGDIWTSYDTVTWIRVYQELSVDRPARNVIYNNNNYLVLGGGTDNIARLISRDGFDWDAELISISGSPTEVYPCYTCRWAENVVASGYWYNGTTSKPLTIVSTDGGETFSFHIIESLSGNRFYDSAYGAGVLVAVGLPPVGSGIIAYSFDGVVWNNCTPAGSTDWYSIAFDGINFYALGYNTRNVAVSTDGISWTVHARSPVAGYISAATYGTSSHTMSLYDIGYNALQTYKPVEVIDGEVLPDAHPLLGSEYNVGDVVDVVDQTRGIIVSKVLSEAQTIYERDKSIIIPKFGENYLSLKKFIKKEIDRLV